MEPLKLRITRMINETDFMIPFTNINTKIEHI